MSNILTYIKNYGELSFDKLTFNELDNLIFSQLAYINFTNIVPNEISKEKFITIKDASDRYYELHQTLDGSIGLLIPDEVLPMLKLLANSKRFSNLKLHGYIQEIDKKETKQFSSLAIEIKENLYYIAFSGTDDTITGWKEDFNMQFMSFVPAQKAAEKYLDKYMKILKGNFILGGHSKGGNLAIYAATKCFSLRKKNIINIYNNDGPGFNKKMLESYSYKKIEDKIIHFVPESSVVGLLFNHTGKLNIVKSSQVGIFQHDAFSWKTSKTEFIECKNLSNESIIINESLKSWVTQMTPEEQKEFINSLFDILESTEATTLTELIFEKFNIFEMIKNSDKKDTQIVGKALVKLLDESRKIIFKNITNKLNKIGE
ncbi:MAG: DUF2974 domain-containing protein [Clostridiales bacterium]|nr:DUF2974 domain-containing protein [Clostridiales bacterium]